MKRKFTFLLVISLVVLAFTSCSLNPGKDLRVPRAIIGSWGYDESKTTTKPDPDEPYADLYVLYRNDIVSYDSNGTRHSMKEDMLDKFYIEIVKTSNADSVYSITVRNNESFEETTISFDYTGLSENQIKVKISDKESESDGSSPTLVYKKLTGKEQTPVE